MPILCEDQAKAIIAVAYNTAKGIITMNTNREVDMHNSEKTLSK